MLISILLSLAIFGVIVLLVWYVVTNAIADELEADQRMNLLDELERMDP